MDILEEFTSNDKDQKAIFLLYYLRGMTAKQLAKLLYAKQDITVSNEKYTYARLKQLEQFDYVQRHKAHPNVSPAAIYFLAQKGHSFALNTVSFNNEYNNPTGWLHDDVFDAGEYPYDLYVPPLKQIKHHLLLVDTAIEILLNNVKYRNNFHAKRRLVTARFTVEVKPDAEMQIHGENYFIEIDRGTESHDQLVSKFQNYFSYYLEFCKLNDEHDFDVQHIVFVVSGTVNGHLERRWNNILAAYYKAFGALHGRIKLHLVTSDMLERFLSVEYWKKELMQEMQAIGELNGFDANTGYFALSSPYSSDNFRILKLMTTFKNNYLSCRATDMYIPQLARYSVDQAVLKIYDAANTAKYQVLNLP